ncbi:MAG: hypothetical protein H0W88_09990 [Parachlamydiaceae bacterium]|nr:hypothetical protein [Parachlamydiaceae bacterium]
MFNLNFPSNNIPHGIDLNTLPRDFLTTFFEQQLTLLNLQLNQQFTYQNLMLPFGNVQRSIPLMQDKPKPSRLFTVYGDLFSKYCEYLDFRDLLNLEVVEKNTLQHTANLKISFWIRCIKFYDTEDQLQGSLESLPIKQLRQLYKVVFIAHEYKVVRTNFAFSNNNSPVAQQPRPIFSELHFPCIAPSCNKRVYTWELTRSNSLIICDGCSKKVLYCIGQVERIYALKSFQLKTRYLRYDAEIQELKKRIKNLEERGLNSEVSEQTKVLQSLKLAKKAGEKVHVVYFNSAGIIGNIKYLYFDFILNEARLRISHNNITRSIKLTDEGIKEFRKKYEGLDETIRKGLHLDLKTKTVVWTPPSLRQVKSKSPLKKRKT